MKHRDPIRWARRALIVAALASATSPAIVAQQEAEGRKLIVEPASLELEIGGKAQLTARVVDDSGKPLEIQVNFFSRSRSGVSVDSEGNVEALSGGDHTVVASSRRRGGPRLRVEIPVVVAYPPVERIEFRSPETEFYTGTTQRIELATFDVTGAERREVQPTLTTSAPQVATFDAFGNLETHAPGEFVANASLEGVSVTRTMRVLANPVTKLELSVDDAAPRTGDVVHFSAVARDAGGAEVAGIPVHLSFVAHADDDLGPSATGQIEQDGRFVAEAPGRYTIVATCGTVAARKTIQASARDVGMRVEVVGHGQVFDTHTSDLWIWEGADGRDYAVTGTWGANGDAHFWDVTDPANIERVSTVTLDARTVNDVKVSEDGRLCVLSREGASNRKNGIVLVDVSDPRNPEIISTFDENLTGGVHNVFVHQGHVYALSAGRRYDVVDIGDPRNPHRVGSFELESRGHSIHDVWVVDGIAYSSNWRDGVQIVDVGNGVAGGSPTNPVKVSSYAYPSGWNHAAFPYTSAQTGRFYVIAGDETFPYGLNVKNTPTYPRGWFHFIDFTEMDHPVEVARYQVPEAGSHNLWVADDVLYAALYNGGVRVVDISGELMGDLYAQGREIAWFIPTHKDGYIANASMVWGPQPYKGNIFFSDWNTGLWCVKLVPGRRRRR